MFRWLLIFIIFGIWFQVSPYPFAVDMAILLQIFPELRKGNIDEILLLLGGLHEKVFPLRQKDLVVERA